MAKKKAKKSGKKKRASAGKRVIGSLKRMVRKVRRN